MMGSTPIVSVAGYFDDLTQGGGGSTLGLGQGIDGSPIAEFNAVDTSPQQQGGSAFARTNLAVQIGGAWVLVVALLVVSYMFMRRNVA